MTLASMLYRSSSTTVILAWSSWQRVCEEGEEEEEEEEELRYTRSTYTRPILVECFDFSSLLSHLG